MTRNYIERVKKGIEETLGHEISTAQFEQIVGRIVRRGNVQ